MILIFLIPVFLLLRMALDSLNCDVDAEMCLCSLLKNILSLNFTWTDFAEEDLAICMVACSQLSVGFTNPRIDCSCIMNDLSLQL